MKLHITKSRCHALVSQGGGLATKMPLLGLRDRACALFQMKEIDLPRAPELRGFFFVKDREWGHGMSRSQGIEPLVSVRRNLRSTVQANSLQGKHMLYHHQISCRKRTHSAQ